MRSKAPPWSSHACRKAGIRQFLSRFVRSIDFGGIDRRRLQSCFADRE
jgi:hypothetical protein